MEISRHIFMIIGIDAGMLGITDERLQVGVWRVAVELLKQLGNMGSNTYRLYSFHPIDPQLLAQLGTTMKNIVLFPSTGFLKIRLSIELFLHPVDCFLALGQALPMVLPKKTIGFVYDVAFLQSPRAYPGSYERLKDQTNDLVKRASHIVTISHTVKKDLIDTYDISDVKISVAYPGLGNEFSLKGKTIQRERLYFLFVGSLKKGKNVPFIIDAFAQFLLTTDKQFDLLLIGSNYWEDPEINQSISLYHLQDRVKRMGFVSDSDLACYYRGATALVSPSIAEGFGLPVVEAMASGCPVIVSDSSVFKEIVGDAGIFVNPRDGKDLSQAMQKVLDISTRKTMNKLGIKRSKLYTWQLFAQRVLQCIKG